MEAGACEEKKGFKEITGRKERRGQSCKMNPFWREGKKGEKMTSRVRFFFEKSLGFQ